MALYLHRAEKIQQSADNTVSQNKLKEQCNQFFRLITPDLAQTYLNANAQKMDSLTQKLIRRCLVNRDCTIDDIYHFREFQELIGRNVINQDKVRPLRSDFRFE